MKCTCCKSLNVSLKRTISILNTFFDSHIKYILDNQCNLKLNQVLLYTEICFYIFYYKKV